MHGVHVHFLCAPTQADDVERIRAQGGIEVIDMSQPSSTPCPPFCPGYKPGRECRIIIDILKTINDTQACHHIALAGKPTSINWACQRCELVGSRKGETGYPAVTFPATVTFLERGQHACAAHKKERRLWQESMGVLASKAYETRPPERLHDDFVDRGKEYEAEFKRLNSQPLIDGGNRYLTAKMPLAADFPVAGVRKFNICPQFDYFIFFIYIFSIQYYYYYYYYHISSSLLSIST